MAQSVKQAITISNPTLKGLSELVGRWETVGSHPYMPGVALHGHTTFDWLEGESFLIMHSEIDEPGIPTGIAIFGCDDSTGDGSMIYFDERGVSRNYEWSFEDHVWKWWRNAPRFAQRMTLTISQDGSQIISRGEMCKDGETWEKDLDLTYTRVK